MTKGRMIIDFETDRFIAEMNIFGDSAGDFARAELDGVKVTQLHVSKQSQVIVRRHKIEPGQCEYCDRERAANNDFHPSHDASDRCESGKRNHCSCDTCF